jgi:hypothetical protein
MTVNTSRWGFSHTLFFVVRMSRSNNAQAAIATSTSSQQSTIVNNGNQFGVHLMFITTTRGGTSRFVVFWLALCLIIFCCLIFAVPRTGGLFKYSQPARYELDCVLLFPHCCISRLVFDETLGRSLFLARTSLPNQRVLQLNRRHRRCNRHQMKQALIIQSKRIPIQVCVVGDGVDIFFFFLAFCC